MAHRYMDEVLLDNLIEKADADADSNNPRSAMTPLGDPPFTEGDKNAPGERYPTTNVTLRPSGKQLRVRVADTPALRATGLQNSPDMGTDYDGMLFKWPGTETQATLHNRGVDVPLSATWFNAESMYVDHAHLLPNDGTPRRAKAPHKYALEVHSRDWDALGLGPGSSISIADEKNQQNNGSVQLGDDSSSSVIK